MYIVSQAKIQPPADHRVTAYEREQVVLLLFACGFTSAKVGCDIEAMYIFFDEQQTIDAKSEGLYFPGWEKDKISVRDVVDRYLNNGLIFAEYHRYVTARETWASCLASMRSYKRSRINA